MHFYESPRHTRLIIVYKILSVSGNSSEKLHCGNVVNMPDCIFENIMYKTLFIDPQKPLLLQLLDTAIFKIM